MDEPTARIIGIDPGSRITGFGIIDVRRGQAWHVHSGNIQLLGDSLTERLGEIFRRISELVAEYQPGEMAIERVFMARNPDSALKLGQARGAAICGAVHASLPVAEYSAREIKQAVVGKGGAAKEQVQHMVKVLLNLRAALRSDQADALAVALCHCHVRETLRRIPVAEGVQGGRLR
jgi:crossover junction endodeoxyribonuclease RuvC